MGDLQIFRFYDRFRAGIEGGTKISTIRADRWDGLRADLGARVDFCVGQSPNQPRKFGSAKIVGVAEIGFIFTQRSRHCDIEVGRERGDVMDKNITSFNFLLARQEGFQQAKDLNDFFFNHPKIKRVNTGSWRFDGVLYRWRDFQPVKAVA